MKTTVTNEDIQIIKPLKINFFNTSEFQTCFEIIKKELAFKLLMKINKVELNKDKIIISELEFFIETIFNQNINKFIILGDITILENTNSDAANNCINIKFNALNVEIENNENEKIIFTKNLTLEHGMGLHFVFYLDGTNCHGGGLCVGNKNCPIHIAGTTIANNK